jgi:L-fuconolactonase
MKRRNDVLSALRISRRRFLVQTATAAAASAAVAEGAEPGRLRILDTHVHFYDPTRPQGVPWPGPGSPIYRRTLPADYVSASGSSAVAGVIVVEASPWLEDNQWLLDLAARERLILGIIGNLTPGTPDFARHLKRFAADPVFRGIRVSGSTLAQQLENPEFLGSMRELADAGLTLDVNGGASALAAAGQLARRFPRLRIVLNHLAGAGDPAAGISADWRDALRLVAQQGNVYCKLSALVEKPKAPYGRAPTQLEYYRPLLDAVWETLGVKRLVYGSNWPVCQRGASLPAVRALVQEYLSLQGPAALDQVFWTNACAAYSLANQRSDVTKPS